MSELGRWLMLAGAGLFVVGALVALFGSALPFGRLPGDLRFGSGNVRVYVPIVSMILLSLILTVVLNIIIRLFGR